MPRLTKVLKGGSWRQISVREKLKEKLKIKKTGFLPGGQIKSKYLSSGDCEIF